MLPCDLWFLAVYLPQKRLTGVAFRHAWFNSSGRDLLTYSPCFGIFAGNSDGFCFAFDCCLERLVCRGQAAEEITFLPGYRIKISVEKE